MIGHIPNEINHGDKVSGSMFSPPCFPSPIATRGLEILIHYDFKIETSKLKLLKRLKGIIERKYDEPINGPVQPIQKVEIV